MSRMYASRVILTIALLLGLAVPFLTSTPRVSAAGFPGAIYTTDVSCGGVNVNIFVSKDVVYLNGGPTGGGPGLPDGEYYVRVIAPGGTLLGTSIGSGDDAPAVVSGGSFAQCYQLSAILIRASDSLPGFDDTTNAGGEYKVEVSPTSDFSMQKSDNFKVFSDDGGGGDNTTLSGVKFYDLDADGERDGTEIGIEGFRIEVYVNDVLFATTTTDANGEWSVADVPVGAEITVCEVLPAANLDGSFWIQTAPDIDPTENDRCYHGTTGTEEITGLDFGNICVRPGSGGFTLGFWSNKNGQAQITGSDLCTLNGLCLRNAAGANFDPVAGCPAPTSSQISTGKTTLKSWLLSGTATNMAYMLSVQLTATKLSTLHGLNGNTIVLLTTDLADCFGSSTAVISNVMSQANSSLCANGVTTAGHPARSVQECYKNILDAINNNQLLFVSPVPCAVNYPPPV